MDGAKIISTRKSTDTWSKMGTISDIYYCNSKRITEHGLQSVTLQDYLVMMDLLVLPPIFFLSFSEVLDLV